MGVLPEDPTVDDERGVEDAVAEGEAAIGRRDRGEAPIDQAIIEPDAGHD